MPRPRVGIIGELRGGLLDAIDAYRAAGHSPGEAAAAALAEFAEPGQVAAAFGPELAALRARHVALTLITTGPWPTCVAAAATASHVAIRRAPRWQWRVPPASLVAVLVLAAATSLIRLTLARRAARHCLTTSAVFT